MRAVHRILALFIVLFTLYLGVTGTMIQLIDLRTLFTQAPATDPNMKAIREGLDGTTDFQVIDVPDYTAPVLPGEVQNAAAFKRALPAIRGALNGAPLQFIELRMADGAPVVQAKTDKRLLRVSATDGSFLSESAPKRAAGGTFGASDRNTFKGFHRLTSIGDWTLWINIVVAVGLCVMLVTGVQVYLTLLAARRKIGKPGLFWNAGGFWRSMHRAISLLSATFVLVVALSGFWLAVESLGRSIMGAQERAMVARGIKIEDPGAPLSDAQLPDMLDQTLAAHHAARGDEPIRAVRLRVYGGMPQGVVITGEPEAHQLVYNADTGNRASLTEPGYPFQHFPFGWQSHQIAKQIHRGDFIGLPGRFMDLFAGLSIIYLTVSGAVMYADMWRRRQKNGRKDLVWK